MATSKTRYFFSWMDEEVKLLFHKIKKYKAAENVDRESSQSMNSNILHQYWEQYLSSKETMFMGTDFPNRNKEISKGM